jgi:hypothetical protein
MPASPCPVAWTSRSPSAHPEQRLAQRYIRARAESEPDPRHDSASLSPGSARRALVPVPCPRTPKRPSAPTTRGRRVWVRCRRGRARAPARATGLTMPIPSQGATRHLPAATCRAAVVSPRGPRSVLKRSRFDRRVRRPCTARPAALAAAVLLRHGNPTRASASSDTQLR